MPGSGFEDLRDKTEKHLDVSDLTMLVLKGHLLVESTLYGAIEKQLHNPEYLTKARLRFPQLIQLARAIFPQESDKRRAEISKNYWDCLEALNTLRNKFAHKLEPAELSALLARLHVRNANSDNPLNDKTVADDFTITVTMLIGYTAGMGDLHAKRQIPEVEQAATGA